MVLTRHPILSLFSGAGGLDLGFHNAGFHPMVAVDNDRAAIETYQRNNPEAVAVCADLSVVHPLDVADIWDANTKNTAPIGIIGGPPCQGFSVANVHQVDHDPRRYLLSNFADIIATFKENFNIEFFAFENVPGLLGKKHRWIYDDFKAMCSIAGFKVSDAILDASTFGVPQYRKRIFIVGINEELHPSIGLELLSGNKNPTDVFSAIGGLPEPTYYTRDLDFDDISYHRNHVTITPKSKRFFDGSLTHNNDGGKSFRILSWNRPSRTVSYGHNEIHIHPNCHRRLSVYEAMVLQGFPRRGYYLYGTLTEQFRLISNAVPPPMAKSVADSIIKSLTEK